MRPRSRMFLSAVAAAAGLLVLSSLMAAATPESGPVRAKLEFRFDDGVYAIPSAQAETVPSLKLSRLSIRLYGAYSRIAAKDINAGADGLFELFEVYGGLGLAGVAGGYEPVHGGNDFGGDVIYQLSPKIGVGLGAGYMRFSEDSLMAVATGTSAFVLEGAPTVSAVPIRLGVFLTMPVAEKIDVTANVGGTLYAGLKLEAEQRIEMGAGDWLAMTVEGSQNRFSNVGFHGGLGFEYRLSRRLGFFVEGQGRYAKLKNFDKVTSSVESNDGGPDVSSGKLYIETSTFTEGSYSTFYVSDTPPLSSPSIIYRQPKLDLSGFSLRVGFRIRL